MAGTYHAVRAINAGRHVVMVNVEADCMVGPLLAERARKSGVVYSMAYGDQPALICELVDWARTVGFEVVAAGKGTKYLPEYHASTPDTVWDHYGFTPEQLDRGDFNPKMFNSFLDGTKSAIEMAAVANGTGLVPQDEGLFFPPCGVDDLATMSGLQRSAVSWPAGAPSRSPPACTATAPRWRETCVGASTSPSKRAPTTPFSASPNTVCARMRPDATARFTGRTT
nr:hypothetical protein [Saccharopolyspora sp. ASAGF58]